ncbi:hypothetical protein CERSUDRAFT_89027 [Gelatoporia subvermispora B]|uniref:Palmitoyltransferase n=1 Tax=Ceriporiopsis subvermispora (strain B) TaxID=914234 RepID=M2Q3Z3_CERS8|nr:hypothetical protein CERSUDRAFT_89027 [Gelatoporia subvermispora B]
MFAHYFYVCTISPGFVEDPPRQPGTGLLWAKKRQSARNRALTGIRWSDDIQIVKASVSRCRRCGIMRPERSHHCRICNRCVLKYDHHCPGINQCVGLYNERHFVLFLVWLSIATTCFTLSGWPRAMDALGWNGGLWTYYSPPVAFLLVYILSVVLSLAVTIMITWHLWGIASGETSVESQDHEHYRKVAQGRGETFINSFDLGKWKNLELFFNVGMDGYPLYTLLLPLKAEPYTDGRHWARRPGFEHHLGLREGEELTDEDDE